MNSELASTPPSNSYFLCMSQDFKCHMLSRYHVPHWIVLSSVYDMRSVLLRSTLSQRGKCSIYGPSSRAPDCTQRHKWSYSWTDSPEYSEHTSLSKVSIVCYVSNNAHVRIPNNNIPHLSSVLIDCGAAGSIQPGLYLKAHVRPYQFCIKRIALVLIDCSAARTVQPRFYLKAHVSPYRSCVKRIALASREPQNQLWNAIPHSQCT